MLLLSPVSVQHSTWCFVALPLSRVQASGADPDIGSARSSISQHSFASSVTCSDKPAIEFTFSPMSSLIDVFGLCINLRQAVLCTCCCAPSYDEEILNCNGMDCNAQSSWNGVGKTRLKWLCLQLYPCWHLLRRFRGQIICLVMMSVPHCHIPDSLWWNNEQFSWLLMFYVFFYKW